MIITNNKLVAVVGPTASGKSELAVRLAKKFNGEIISVDSRQIYREMDLGTGKIPGKWRTRFFHGREKSEYYIYKNIVHHCIDFINPKRRYSVALFKKQAQKKIQEIQKRGHLPILCGGTGHWVDAVVFNQQLPEVKPNLKLRLRLEKQSAGELYCQLQKLDPVRAANIDKYNKRRLIRALEIVITTGKPVPPVGADTIRPLHNDVLWLGINLQQDQLYKKIDKRLKQRLDQGMVKEIRDLHNSGLSWKRLESFGLEYKYISLFLQKKLSYEEMFTQLSYAIKHYAKRQMTWFKRNQNIHWVKTLSQAQKLMASFCK